MAVDTLGIGHSFQHRMLTQLGMQVDHDILDYNSAKELASLLGIDHIIAAHYMLTRRYMVNDLFDQGT